MASEVKIKKNIYQHGSSYSTLELNYSNSDPLVVDLLYSFLIEAIDKFNKQTLRGYRNI